jgi:Domain of unknown function (DUF4184)
VPFTLAHPIAALPLWLGFRKRLNLLGLMVGTIVPDLAYLLALRPIESFGHTVLGALTQGLLEGLILFGIVRYGLMRPLLAIAPQMIAQRCQKFRAVDRLDWVYLIILVISIWLGAISHIVWDSFTHPTGWAVQHWVWLQYAIGRLPIYKLLQYGSGLFGLLGLGVWAWQAWSQARVECSIASLPRRGKVAVWCGIGLVAGLMMGFAIVRDATPGEGIAAIGVRGIIGLISGTFVGMGLWAIGFWVMFFSNYR